MRASAYKGLVRPVLEYGSSVWDPYCVGLNDELEIVQKRAARFVTRNYTFEEVSMTGILATPSLVTAISSMNRADLSRRGAWLCSVE